MGGQGGSQTAALCRPHNLAEPGLSNSDRPCPLHFQPSFLFNCSLCLESFLSHLFSCGIIIYSSKFVPNTQYLLHTYHICLIYSCITIICGYIFLSHNSESSLKNEADPMPSSHCRAHLRIFHRKATENTPGAFGWTWKEQPRGVRAARLWPSASSEYG